MVIERNCFHAMGNQDCDLAPNQVTCPCLKNEEKCEKFEKRVKKSDCPHVYSAGTFQLCNLTSTTCSKTIEMKKCNRKLNPDIDCPKNCQDRDVLCYKMMGCTIRDAWLSSSVKKNKQGQTITKNRLDDLFKRG